MTEHDPFLQELQQRADRAHTSADRADDAPPDLWQRVTAQVKSNAKEHTTMNATILTAEASRGPGVYRRVPPANSANHRGFSHYANLAVTIAMVVAVAVAGWFATMQLNQPGGSNDQFAFAPGTPEVASATCDVDPVTVDEVMEIVRNPYRYMYDRADSESDALVSYEYMARQELAVGFYFPTAAEYQSVNRTNPSQSEFEEASEAVNSYIVCMRDATNGQYWALSHPIWVQEQVLSQFPVFADEESVRAYVEEVIDQPVEAMFNRLNGFYNAYGDAEIVANPDPELADLILYSSADYEPTIAMGVLVTGSDGEVILETGSTGFPHQVQPGAVTLRPVIVVQKSSATGEWYVMPYGSM